MLENDEVPARHCMERVLVDGVPACHRIKQVDGAPAQYYIERMHLVPGNQIAS